MAMVLPGIIEEWNYWTDCTDPRDFMDQARARDRTTIGAAVDAYIVEIIGVHHEWAGLNAEELEEIRHMLMLMAYLFLTRGVEWPDYPRRQALDAPIHARDSGSILHRLLGWRQGWRHRPS